LFERQGRNPGQLVGRSPWLQAVQTDAPETLIGTMADVIVERVGGNSLFARLADTTSDRKSIASPSAELPEPRAHMATQGSSDLESRRGEPA